MTKTTATLEYRTYIPTWTIAVTYCHLRFYGKNATKFSNEWYDIEHQFYLKYTKPWADAKDAKEMWKRKYEKAKKLLKRYKPWWMFWETKQVFWLRRRVEIRKEQYEKFKELSDKMLGSDNKTWDTLHAARRFLDKYGFVLVHRDTNTRAATDTTDIYELIHK